MPHGTRSVKPNRPAAPGAASSWNHFPDDAPCLFGGDFNRLAGTARLEPGFGEDFSLLRADRSSQLLFAPLHDFGGPAEQIAAIVRGHRSHRFGPADQRRNRRVDVGGRGTRDRVDDESVVRIVDVELFRSIDPFGRTKHLHRRTVIETKLTIFGQHSTCRYRLGSGRHTLMNDESLT